MLGWVAAVSETLSPSQLSPALIHSTWIRVCSAATASAVGMGRHRFRGGVWAHISAAGADLSDPLSDALIHIYHPRADWCQGTRNSAQSAASQSCHCSRPTPERAETARSSSP